MRFESYFRIEKWVVCVQGLEEADPYLTNPWKCWNPFSSKDPPCLVGKKIQEIEETFQWTRENCVERVTAHASPKQCQGKSPLGMNLSLFIWDPSRPSLVVSKVLAWMISGKVFSSPFPFCRNASWSSPLRLQWEGTFWGMACRVSPPWPKLFLSSLYYSFP